MSEGLLMGAEMTQRQQLHHQKSTQYEWWFINWRAQYNLQAVFVSFSCFEPPWGSSAGPKSFSQQPLWLTCLGKEESTESDQFQGLPEATDVFTSGANGASGQDGKFLLSFDILHLTKISSKMEGFNLRGSCYTAHCLLLRFWDN